MIFKKKNNNFSTELSSSAIVIVCISIACCIGSWVIGSGIYDSISYSEHQIEALDKFPDMIGAPEYKIELKEEIFQKKIGFYFCVLVGVLSFVSFCAFFPEAFNDLQSYFHHVEPAVVQTTTGIVTEAGILYFPRFTEVHWEVLVDHLATFGTKIPSAAYADMTALFNNMFKDAVGKPVMFKLETMAYILRLSTSDNPEVYATLVSTNHPGAEVFIEFIRSRKG